MRKKIALIPGGARGIGRAIGISLAASAWDVAFCYRTSEAEANRTLAAIRNAGVRGISERCDVSNPQAAEALVNKVENEWGRIDALINCFGPYHRIPFFEETIEGWHELFDNNLHPIFYLSRAVAEGMKKKQWGRIINFSVANADKLIAQPNVSAYSISKAGVLILTRTLAKLLAPHGITANAISPGFIESNGLSTSDLNEMKIDIPAGFIGETKDVVAVVKFLLSEEARYVNGANIHVSGGWGI